MKYCWNPDLSLLRQLGACCSSVCAMSPFQNSWLWWRQRLISDDGKKVKEANSIMEKSSSSQSYTTSWIGCENNIASEECKGIQTVCNSFHRWHKFHDIPWIYNSAIISVVIVLTISHYRTLLHWIPMQADIFSTLEQMSNPWHSCQSRSTCSPVPPT